MAEPDGEMDVHTVAAYNTLYEIQKDGHIDEDT
jgi:hypothetical protein